MTGQHPVIAFDLVHSRQDTMLQQADAKRLTQLAAEQQTDLPGGLRRWVGLALVRLGEQMVTRRRSVASTRFAVDAGDRAISAGVLRLSR